MSNKIGYGLADITIGGVDIGSQGAAAELTFEPRHYDIEDYELGDAYDMILDSWNVQLKVTFQEEDYEKYKMAIPMLADIGTTGLQDGVVGQSARAKAKEIVVHPKKAGTSQEFDITVFKGYPTGTVVLTYGKEKRQYEVTFKALPNTSDTSIEGNYFRIGTLV
jgi:hypothetical protein